MNAPQQKNTAQQSTELQTAQGTQLQREGGRQSEGPALIPAIDVIEDEGGITLLADMPGATKDGLSIQVEGDALTLEAPVELGAPQNMQPLYAEVRSPRYRRSFTLSRELDCNRIDASLKDGVLQLRVPKLEEAKPRRIEVRAS